MKELKIERSFSIEKNKKILDNLIKIGEDRYQLKVDIDFFNYFYEEDIIFPLPVIGILENLKKYSVIIDYKLDNNNDLVANELFEASNLSGDFFDKYNKCGGIYIINANIDKLNFFIDLIERNTFNKEIIGIGLFNTIQSIIKRLENSDFEIELEKIIDYIDIDNNLYLIENTDYFLLSLANYKKLYIARLLDFLFERLLEKETDNTTKHNSKVLKEFINLDKNYIYSEKTIEGYSSSGNIYYLDKNYIKYSKPHISIRTGKITDNKNLIYQLTDLELEIIKKLNNHIKDLGILEKNLAVMVYGNNTEKNIKYNLKKKIENLNKKFTDKCLEKYIFINKNSIDNSYNLLRNGI